MQTVKPLTKIETAELRKIDRLQMRGKATRSQLLRGLTLHYRENAAYRATHSIPG